MKSATEVAQAWFKWVMGEEVKGKMGQEGAVVKVDRIVRLRGDGKTKAFADILISDRYVVKGIRVMEGVKGLFVGLPGRRDDKGEFVPGFKPITKEAREALHKVVMEAFHATDKAAAVFQKEEVQA